MHNDAKLIFVQNLSPALIQIVVTVFKKEVAILSILCNVTNLVIHTNELFTFIFQLEMPAGLGFGQSEYYPYVYYKINIDMVGNPGVAGLM